MDAYSGKNHKVNGFDFLEE